MQSVRYIKLAGVRGVIHGSGNLVGSAGGGGRRGRRGRRGEYAQGAGPRLCHHGHRPRLAGDGARHPRRREPAAAHHDEHLPARGQYGHLTSRQRTAVRDWPAQRPRRVPHSAAERGGEPAAGRRAPRGDRDLDHRWRVPVLQRHGLGQSVAQRGRSAGRACRDRRRRRLPAEQPVHRPAGDGTGADLRRGGRGKCAIRVILLSVCVAFALAPPLLLAALSVQSHAAEGRHAGPNAPGILRVAPPRQHRPAHRRHPYPHQGPFPPPSPTCGGTASPSPYPSPTGSGASPSPYPSPTGSGASPSRGPSPSPSPTGSGPSPSSSPTRSGPSPSPSPTSSPSLSPSATAQAPSPTSPPTACLLYTSDAADELLCVDLG